MNTPLEATPPPLAGEQKTSGMAIAALVLGIVSFICTAILVVPTVLAIVFGHMSYAKIRSDRRLKGAGLAMAGFILGYLSIFSTVVVGLLAAMAIPAFQKVREASLHKAMQNDARQIGSAAQQVMLENGGKPVAFHIDPNTGVISGPLSAYVHQVSKGMVEVDGSIDSADDTFSLKNRYVLHGQEVIFDAEGREMKSSTGR